MIQGTLKQEVCANRVPLSSLTARELRVEMMEAARRAVTDETLIAAVSRGDLSQIQDAARAVGFFEAAAEVWRRGLLWTVPVTSWSIQDSWGHIRDLAEGMHDRFGLLARARALMVWPGKRTHRSTFTHRVELHRLMEGVQINLLTPKGLRWYKAEDQSDVIVLPPVMPRAFQAPTNSPGWVVTMDVRPIGEVDREEQTTIALSAW